MFLDTAAAATNNRHSAYNGKKDFWKDGQTNGPDTYVVVDGQDQNYSTRTDILFRHKYA